MPELLEHVRLPLMAKESLVERAAAEPLASAGVRVKDLVIEALSFHLMRPEWRAAAAATSARARPRLPPAAPKVLLVVGGQAPKAIRDVEEYLLDAGHWRSCADLLTRRCRAGLAVLHGKVYAVGGFNGEPAYIRKHPNIKDRSSYTFPRIVRVKFVGCTGTLRVRTVDVYDTATDTWSAGPALGARRSTLGVAVIGNVIYAVGG